MNKEGREPKPGKGCARRAGRLWRRFAIGAPLACCVLAVIFYWGVPFLFSLPGGLEDWTPPGVVVKDRGGLVLVHLPGQDHYRGSHASLEDLPGDFINATLVAEDKRFYSHGGMDFRALARAAVSQVSGLYRKSGASTITQQLVKIASPPASRNLATKFRECMAARRLEMTWDKEKILASYFDRLDYGSLRLGPGAAAEYYFGKRLKDLSLGQMALLAGLPQSPTRLNPGRNPGLAVKRRNWILKRLEQELGYDTKRIERARNEPLELAAAASGPRLAPHLMSRLLQEERSAGEVATTIDAGLQEKAQNAVRHTLSRLEPLRASQAAVVVIHNPTGEILAWVGSGNREEPRGGLIDGVLVPRSAGSTLKPFVYALAFEKGSWPGEVLADVPIRFRSREGVDAPRNYNNVYRGPLTVREALACSQNIPAMSALKRAGGPEQLVPLLRELGLSTLDRPAGHYGLGLAIGNAEVKLLELSNAYATLARGGVARPAFWKKAEAPAAEEARRVLPEDVCFLITDILADPLARVSAFGMNGPLDVGFPCAVKTGTSSDFRDNWCIGYTKDVTVGVWVGNFDYTPMRHVSGVSGAGPVFHAVMTAAGRMFPSSFSKAPAGYRQVLIDKRNGLRVNPGDVPRVFSVMEWVPGNALPAMAGKADYDARGRALLDNRYRDWFGSADNSGKDAYALSEDVWRGEPPAITSPLDGAVFLLDPEMPNQGRILHLKSNLPHGAVWSCDTLSIGDDHGQPSAELAPGTHVIRVRDERSGLESETSIRVREL